MKKSQLAKPILMSALSALAFGVVGASGTFALFTDKAETTVSVGAGKVDVGTSIKINSVQELGEVDVTADANGVYTNSVGGTVKVEGNAVSLSKWVPGDKAVFEIRNVNFSDVKTKIRFVETHTHTSTLDLYDALTISYRAYDEDDNVINNFMEWQLIDPASDLVNGTLLSRIVVTVEFPNHGQEITVREQGIDNAYQEANCSILFKLEAVQGNAQVTSLLDQLNADLLTASHVTMHDALNEVADIASPATICAAGYVWNAKEDQFHYPQEVVAEKQYECFKMYQQMPDYSNFSIYAFASTWDEDDITLTGIGFDAGNAAGIDTISYVGAANARTNVIRTNSANTSLTINAANDVVNHYGTVGALNIIAVANSSYHEFGKVAFVEIKKGRIVLEEASKVEKIHLNTTETATDTHFDNITVAKAENVVMPEFSRDPVSIPDEGRLVVALQDGTDVNDNKDYVWLTAVGIYEQVTVSESKTEAGSTFAAELSGSEASEKKETAQQIANNITATVGGEDYKVTAEKTVVNNEIVWNYVLDSDTADNITEDVAVTVVENVATVTVDSVSASETVIENGLSEQQKNQAKETAVAEKKEEFCPGHIMYDEATERLHLHCPLCDAELGTQSAPYLIDNADHLEALIKHRDWEGYPGYYRAYRTDASGENYENLYAELTADIDCSDIDYPTGYSDVYYLILNGNNHTLSNMDEQPFNNGYGITLKNVKFYNFTGSKLMGYCYYGFDFENVTFDHCAMDYVVQYPIKGQAEDDFYCKNVNFKNSSFGSVFAYMYDSCLTMKDCEFDSCISSTGSALLAYGMYHYYSGYALGMKLDNVDMKDCKAYGGAYVYYGGKNDCPITFKNCDVTNTTVTGGNGMALGGFVGNASASHVVFDTCTFGGRIESVSQIAAGFIGQPNNSADYCLISNSSISAATVILNKGGSAVAAFNGQGNNYNNNNNHFYGTLSSTGTKSNATLNGFADATFAKYGAAATIADFALANDGTLTYSGSESFSKIVVSQRLAVDEMKSGLGGYPWQVAPTLTVENVSGASTLGTIAMVHDLVQVVDEEHLETVRYASTDTSLLAGNCIDENSGIYLNDGVLVLNSQMYSSGAWYIFSGTGVNSAKTTFTVSILIELYQGEELVCSVPMSYSFTPTQVAVI